MSEPGLNFAFFVGGIEDGIVELLKQTCPYQRDVETYGGELDKESLRDALAELALRFPLFLVSYTQGKDKRLTPLGPEIDAPVEYRHDCTFTVICCDDNARGQKERRRGLPATGAHPGEIGVYRMISDVKSALERKQLSVIVEGQTVVLNAEPFNPAGIDYIAHLPEQTAYAVYFDTYFVYRTPDRRVVGTQVSEIDVVIYPNGAPQSGQRPGVILK